MFMSCPDRKLPSMKADLVSNNALVGVDRVEIKYVALLSCTRGSSPCMVPVCVYTVWVAASFLTGS